MRYVKTFENYNDTRIPYFKFIKPIEILGEYMDFPVNIDFLYNGFTYTTENGDVITVHINDDKANVLGTDGKSSMGITEFINFICEYDELTIEYINNNIDY